MHDMNGVGTGMDGMSMMNMGPSIGGWSLVVLLMIASGIVYLACASVLLKRVEEEKNELISALFAFFIYQAISMVFMGLEMHTMNFLFLQISALAIFIGSSYMIKFIFSSFAERTRKIAFYLSLAVGLGIFAWFIQTPAREVMLFNFSLWYDLIINGVLVGGSIIYVGIRASQNWLKIKALGGGSGVVACCVVSNATMLGGAFFLSSFFQFLAPVIILSSLFIARKKQNEVIVPQPQPAITA